jgi:hypothetical protein
MTRPIFPWGVGAGAAWVVVLLLAVPLRSPAATPDQNKLQSGPRGVQSADSLGVSFGALSVGDSRGCGDGRGLGRKMSVGAMRLSAERRV